MHVYINNFVCNPVLVYMDYSGRDSGINSNNNK